jgi:hypothetical protein
MIRSFAAPTYVSLAAQDDQESPPADAPATQVEEPAEMPEQPADTTEAAKPEAPAAVDQQPSADGVPAEQPATAEDGQADAEPAGEAMPEDAVAAESGQDDQPVAYKPLEEVADEIRRNLARAPAQEAMNEALKAARSEIENYFKERIKWQALSAEDPELVKPVPVDTEALADRLGLVAGETPLVDELEIEDYELGKAYQFSFAQGQMARLSFAQIAFNAGLPLYKTDQIKSFEVDVEFLYWKVDEKEPFVPELAEIRDEVIEFWKQRQAFSIAVEEAERLAEAAAGDKPLSESLDEQQARDVIETGEFSWLSRGAMPVGYGAPTLSDVPGIQAPGEQFMQSVFSLDVGQTGVAVNAPETVVYVVRVVGESPDEEQRRQQFITSGMTFDTFYVAMAERQQFLEQWFEGLEQEMRVDWKRQPEEIPAFE